MKKIFNLSALFVVLCFSLVACQKDYDSTPDVVKPALANTLKGTFSCKINGLPFIAEQKTVQIIDVNGMQTLSISAILYGVDRTTSDYQTITISIPNYSGNQRYLIGSTAQIAYTISDNNFVTNYISSITNPNYHVTIKGNYVGTFNTTVAQVGNASNKVVITEGKFDIQ